AALGCVGKPAACPVEKPARWRPPAHLPPFGPVLRRLFARPSTGPVWLAGCGGRAEREGMTQIPGPARSLTRIRMSALLVAALTVLGAASPSGTPVADSAGSGWPDGDGTIKTVGKIVSVLPSGEVGLCSGSVV